MKSYKYLGVEIEQNGTLDSCLLSIKKRVNYLVCIMRRILQNLSCVNRIILWMVFARPYFHYVLPVVRLQSETF